MHSTVKLYHMYRLLFSSVAHLFLTLCYPMNRSPPGLPVHHQFPEFIQTHVHRVSEPSSHLILCRPLLLLPSIFPSIRIFSNGSALCMRWPKYWSFSFSIIPSKEHPEHPGLNTTVQKQQFFAAQLSSQFNSHIHT